jgi:hypothetical protein
MLVAPRLLGKSPRQGVAEPSPLLSRDVAAEPLGGISRTLRSAKNSVSAASGMTSQGHIGWRRSGDARASKRVEVFTVVTAAKAYARHSRWAIAQVKRPAVPQIRSHIRYKSRTPQTLQH